ncbi:MAG: type II toxin-antitoxin system VapC family toxin [Nitrosopumilus sp.]|nr:type II toxin-antitoxin system VapC family toxin [Nitrosopumilus sp.]
MKQTQIQKIALDSCVVIDLIEKPQVASGLKARLKGKSIKVVLCDVVLNEVQRVRGLTPQIVIEKISKILGREIELSEIDEQNNSNEITNQFQICHNGDNKILSLCQAKDFVLVTFDRMLLKACEFVGVVGFHPSMVRGI